MSANAEVRVFNPTLEEVLQINARAYADTWPEHVDFIFGHGHVVCNQPGVQDEVARLSEIYPYAVVCIGGLEPADPELPGFTYEKSQLVKRGIAPERILGLTAETRIPPSTDYEGVAIVQNAEKNAWACGIYVTAGFHAIRALVTDVSPILKNRSSLKLYAHVSRTDSWTLKRRNNQLGEPTSWMENLIGDEWRKLKKYYKQGDHFSFAEVLEYLDRRDREAV